MITKDQKADLITNAAIEAAVKVEGQRHWDNDPSPEDGDMAIALAEDSFRRGALWMQAEMEKLIEQRELVAWDAAREPRKWTQVFGPQSHIPEGQRYETFEDWKKAK